MKITKAKLTQLIESILKEDMAASKKDLPTLLKMYKHLGAVIQKASQQMRIGR